MNKAVILDPQNGEAFQELLRTGDRLNEQTHGIYCFSAMRESMKANSGMLDHASFVKNTRIGYAGHHGQRLFATKNLKAGEVVMVEKAFLAEFSSPDASLLRHSILNVDHKGETGILSGTDATRFLATVNKLMYNPQQARRYLKLWDGLKFPSKDAPLVDGKVALNIFQIATIERLNGFGCPNADGQDTNDRKSGSGGLWLHAAYLNHSCVPNAYRTFLGNMMMIRATTDISTGDELFVEYRPGQDPCAQRKEELAQYGFKCDCALCAADSNTPAELLADRDRLQRVAEIFANATPWNRGGTEAGLMRQARDLQSEIKATYAHPRGAYDRLPRIACFEIDCWLTMVTTGWDAVAAAMRLVRDMGYFITVAAAGEQWGTVDRDRAIASQAAVVAIFAAKEAYLKVVEERVAMGLLALAAQTWVIFSGSLEGFDAFQKHGFPSEVEDE